MILLKQIAKLNITIVAVKAFFIGVFFFSLLAVIGLYYFSYELFTTTLLDHYGKTNKLELFRSSYLTPGRYFLFRLFSVVLLIFFSLILIRLKLVSHFFASKLFSFSESVKQFGRYLLEYYLKLTFAQKSVSLFTLLMIGAVKWFFLTRYYFHIDEIFSYLFFVRKGFFVLISYYPGPNNHILYSLIAYVVQPLFSNAFYLMKVPSFVVSLITSCFFFLFLLRYYSFQLSIIGTLLLSFSGNFFFYSLFGRGYILMTFFTMVAAFMVVEIISGKDEKFKWHIYTFSSILAFYSMLGYLYAFITFGLLTAGFIVYEKKYSLLKSYFYYHGFVVVCVLLLYTPVLLVSGLSSLISNPWVARLDRSEFFIVFPEMIKSMFAYILNIEQNAFYIAITIVFITGITLLKRDRKPLFFLLVFLFTIPLLVLMIQHVRPFDRIWTYLIVPFSICLVALLDFFYSFFTKKMYIKTALSVLIVVAITSYTVYSFYKDTNHGYGIYDDVSRISREVVEQGNGNVYTNEDVYNLYLRYEWTRKGKDQSPETSSMPKPLRYSHVLLVPGSAFPSSIDDDLYHLKEKNEYIEVYQLMESSF